MGKLRLRIVTPTEVKVDEDTDMVVMRCLTGDMGIQPGHEERSAALDYGIARVFEGGVERRIAIAGGIAKVSDDVLTIITGGAEWPEDIDRTIAEEEREAAIKRIQESNDKVEIQRSQVSLRRALVQIEVSAYPVVSK